MQNFELYNPVRVVFGPGKFKDLAAIVKGFWKKALIVSYESHDFFASLLPDTESALTAEGIGVLRFYHVQANPLLSHIQAAVELCRAEQVDFVIGIGGGSVMDSTKVIAAGVHYEGELWKMFVSRHDQAVAVPPASSLPTVMVPTLPATSSEMNCIAVATNDQTLEKAYVWTPVIFPTVSVIDPALTKTLPAYQTAVGAVDAMSHILEAYLNGDQHSPVQDRLHEGLLRAEMDELRAVLANPEDVAHRANLQWAASLSWNGYLQSGLNAPTPMHQMGHVLSALYNTTHGVTLAIFMDAYFRYTATLNAERSARFALLGRHLFGIREENDVLAARMTVEAIIAFMDEVGVPHTLRNAGIPASDIEKIADEIVAHGCDANGFLPSLPPIGRDGIVKILHMAEGEKE